MIFILITGLLLAVLNLNKKNEKMDTYSFDSIGKDIPPLIAHAGGGYKKDGIEYTYTNSREAFEQNYAIGHRIFEFDFYFTSDKKLASIHDWEEFGYKDGTPMSEAEWLNFKEPHQLQNLMLSDILDLMIEHEDMFLVTDTKSNEVSPMEQIEQYTMLYNEVISRSPELLNRVFPQVYNGDILRNVEILQKFPFIIFTAYSTLETSEEIFQLFETYDNIKMFTTATFNQYIDDQDFIRKLKKKGIFISVHTINDLEELSNPRYKKADGFYTDFITPDDWNNH